MVLSNWKLDNRLSVFDCKSNEYLVINAETGRWVRCNTAALDLINHKIYDAHIQLPEALAALFAERIVNPVLASRINSTEKLLYVVYKLTDRCNYKCAYCYDKQMAKPLRRLKRNLRIREVLNAALADDRTYVQVLFHGGEPLLECSELFNLVKEYSEYMPTRLLFSLQTNGSLLRQKHIDFINQFGIGLCISVDGDSYEMNRLRNVGRNDDPYLNIIEHVGTLSGFIISRIGILITVGEHNVDAIPEALERMQAVGFTSVSFSFMQCVSESARMASVSALTSMFDRIVDAIAKGRLSSLNVGILTNWIRTLIGSPAAHLCFASPCGAGREVISVSCDGRISPCDSLFDEKFTYPDLAAYNKALNADSELIKLITRSTNTLPKCSSCEVRIHCNGTCPGRAILEYGKAQNSASHDCKFNYSIIKNLMWHLSSPYSSDALIQYCYKHSNRESG